MCTKSSVEECSDYSIIRNRPSISANILDVETQRGSIRARTKYIDHGKDGIVDEVHQYIKRPKGSGDKLGSYQSRFEEYNRVIEKKEQSE